MFALIRKSDNTVAEIVSSTAGYDLAQYNVVTVSGEPSAQVWNGTAFVTRPQTSTEQARATLLSDTLWSKLDTATPSQIDIWLTANVTDLTSARKVLKFILLALGSLRASRSL